MVRFVKESADLDPVDPRDAGLVDRWLDLLGVRGRPTALLPLRGGRSDAGVFLLDLRGRRLLLKVSTSVAGQRLADRELRFYTDLAPLLPIRVPDLVAATAGDTGVALLMEAHDPSPKAREWSVERWVEVAAGAGRLHGQVEVAGAATQLDRPPEASRSRIAWAEERWRVLGYPQIAELVQRLVPEVTATMATAPRTIIHGDCHVENFLLAADGGLIWADWQEVALGAGPEDLALLWQRAEFDGARPPRSEMMTAYGEARGTISDETLERVVLAAELRLLLVDWPHHLADGSHRQRRTVVERVSGVVRGWECWVDGAK